VLRLLWHRPVDTCACLAPTCRYSSECIDQSRVSAFYCQHHHFTWRIWNGILTPPPGAPFSSVPLHWIICWGLSTGPRGVGARGGYSCLFTGRSRYHYLLRAASL